MAAFSTRLCTALACLLVASGCEAQQATGTDTPRVRAETPSRPPVDPGDEGQSRNLLQHYRARDLAAQASGMPPGMLSFPGDSPSARKQALSIPYGPRLALESEAWMLPFHSKWMIAVFLTSLSRGAVDEMRHVLAPNATFGRPDPRRPHERPIFEDDNLLEFFDGVSAAAARFDEKAKYTNPTPLPMGFQERIRAGAEPMWAFYTAGPDLLMFRLRAYGNRAYIDYVGFFPDAPSEPVDYSALGPAPPFAPAAVNRGNQIVRDFGPNGAQAPARRPAPPRPTAARAPTP